MEVPRLGLKSKLQLQAYTTVTAMGIRHGSVIYTTAQENARSSPSEWGQGSNPPPHAY